MTDFITINNGSIVVVEARTPEAEARLEEIIVENGIESYLRVGPHGVAVEHRYAGLWTENLQSEGFSVSDADDLAAQKHLGMMLDGAETEEERASILEDHCG